MYIHILTVFTHAFYHAHFECCNMATGSKVQAELNKITLI